MQYFEQFLVLQKQILKSIKDDVLFSCVTKIEVK